MSVSLDYSHLPPSGRPAGLAVPHSGAAVRPRLDSIDLLRGGIMMLMALDHTRDFFGASGMNPRDVTDPALFLTRWITHYCAPLFIFLAGISAYLYGARGRATSDVSRFLFTRGVWLMLIEVTVVRLGWSFSLNLEFFITQVIWVIGASMVVLAGLVWLPRWAIAAIGLTMIAGHNLLDGIKATDFGAAGPIWNFLHQPALVKFGDVTVFALYPLIPWAGVMAAGYALGPVFGRDAASRRRWLVGLGVGTTALFVILRASNLYGDPAAWSPQGSVVATVLSFINCEKYPPSLLYLAMTIGLGLVVLGMFQRVGGRLSGVIVTIGRVPFLFYVAHIALLHAIAIVVAYLTVGDCDWLFRHMPAFHKPAGYGLSLPAVYALWIAALALLYPMCRWFGALKQRRKDWWLSYL
jgi:uncharacterized membrane protein